MCCAGDDRRNGAIWPLSLGVYLIGTPADGRDHQSRWGIAIGFALRPRLLTDFP